MTGWQEPESASVISGHTRAAASLRAWCIKMAPVVPVNPYTYTRAPTTYKNQPISQHLPQGESEASCTFYGVVLCLSFVMMAADKSILAPRLPTIDGYWCLAAQLLNFSSVERVSCHFRSVCSSSSSTSDVPMWKTHVSTKREKTTTHQVDMSYCKTRLLAQIAQFGPIRRNRNKNGVHREIEGAS